MSNSAFEEAQAIMRERFGCDKLIALATVDGSTPCVRAVNAYYEDGSFYVITHAKSAKMRQIEKNPAIAICGDWFTAHGIGENLGYIRDERNSAIAEKLRSVFAAWYGNGHVNEEDVNTCILQIKLTGGVLMSHGRRYEMDFVNEKVSG